MVNQQPPSLIFLCNSVGAIVNSGGGVRIELDGLVVVLDGAVVLAFVFVGKTAIVEGESVVRIKFDDCVASLNRLVVGGVVEAPFLELVVSAPLPLTRVIIHPRSMQPR